MPDNEIIYCVLQSGHCCTECLECAYQRLEILEEEKAYGDDLNGNG